MPRAEHFPVFETTLEEIPAKTNPLGVKGIGESGTIGAPPTVINAHPRCAAAARRRAHRHAGDRRTGVGRDAPRKAA